MHSTVDVLKNARALIDDPKKWGQGLGFSRPDTFCAAEAIEKVTRVSPLTNDNEYGKMVDARKRAFTALEKATGWRGQGLDSVTRWNDTNTHETVLAGFDKAIATEEQRAASK